MNIAVLTEPATDVKMFSAWINGSWTQDDRGSIEPGFEWKKGIDGEVHFYWYPGGTREPGSHDISYWLLGMLDVDQIYYFRFGLKFEDYTYWGDWESFTTTTPSIVATMPATDIETFSAWIHGTWTQDDRGSIEPGFEWKKGIDGEVHFYWYPGGTREPGSHDISYWLLGLDPGQIYYFRSGIKVHLGGDIYWGSWSSFITGPVSSAVTKEATQIENLKATLNGQTIVGGDGCVESAFEWKKGEGGTIQTEIVLNYGGVDFSVTITDLIFNTVYYFRARGRNDSVEYFYGEWLSFTTTCITPTVTTQIAIDIESTSVTGNGTIIDIGGGEPHCIKKGAEVTYSFSGTLEEHNAWKGHGFIGDVTFNSVTGLWEGTLTKSYEESGSYPIGVFALSLDDLICDKEYLYRARARNTAGWGYGGYLAFTTSDLLKRKSCTLGIFTIMLCAYVKPISSGSRIKRRGFRWGIYNSAQEYDIHEDGNFSASAIIGPVDTISFVCSNDPSVYDTIVDSAGGFLTAGFVAGKFIDVSATGPINPANEGQFKIISVTAGTITVNVRNTLVSECPPAVTGVVIVDLFALYIVDLDPKTDYYSVAYVAIEDSLGNWTVQEGNVTLTTTIDNIFDFEGYDKVEFYKPEREQNYKKITRKIEAEIIAEQQYIDKVGGRRILDIPNHLIQTKGNAVEIGTNYKERFKSIKSLMGIEFPTPAPFQREDTLDIGFGRIRFKEDDKGVINFMPDGEGLMLFRYRMIMMIRKIDMGQSISEESVDYLATMELEEA